MNLRRQAVEGKWRKNGYIYIKGLTVTHNYDSYDRIARHENIRPSSSVLMSVELYISSRIEQRYFDICINYRLAVLVEDFMRYPEWPNDSIYADNWRFMTLFLSREKLFNHAMQLRHIRSTKTRIRNTLRYVLSIYYSISLLYARGLHRKHFCCAREREKEKERKTRIREGREHTRKCIFVARNNIVLVIHDAGASAVPCECPFYGSVIPRPGKRMISTPCHLFGMP